MTYNEVLAAAKTEVGPYCKACPVCNGRACGSTIPGPGAKGTGDVAIRNFEAWRNVRINLDTISENKKPDTTLELFGKTLQYPFFAGPVGAVQLHYGDKYNALYILTHNDTTINVEEVLSLTSDRADLQMEYTETRAVFSKATQLLREDLTHKPDLRWLYAILLTLAIVAIALALYIKRKHRKHQLISQQVEDLQQKHDELSEQNLLLESNLSKRQKKMLAEIEAFCKTIQDDSDLKAKLSWNNFDKMCEIVDDRMYGLATKLKERYSMDLNNLRICVLITIGNFTNKEMATILSYDEHTFRTIKNRVAKNLNVSGKNMRDFFLKETIGA